MDVRLIQVPSHAGDEQHGTSSGPARLVEAGARGLLVAHGIDVKIETVARDAPFRDTAASAARVNKSLAATIREAVDRGDLPIVLAGSCNAALGVVAGFEHARCGVVWIDAHADFNTPESTTSGFFPGMSMAVLTGHCFSSYWAQIGDNTPIAEENIAIFGVRELSPDAERHRLEQSPIRDVPWRDGQAQDDVIRVLDELRQRTTDVYLHVDFDAFAPEVAPGVADDPVHGGLSLADAETIIRGTVERFRIQAVTLATYTPAADEDEKTLGVALRLVDVLGEYAASGG